MGGGIRRVIDVAAIDHRLQVADLTRHRPEVSASGSVALRANVCAASRRA